MSAAINSPVTLLPAAFGILVLQKAYGVARASVTPRLLPAEITLVTANARSQLITLTASMLGGAVAAGIQATAGSAWVLRAGTLIYLAAMFLALRLPDQVDVPPAPAAPVPPPAAADPSPDFPNGHGRYAPAPGDDAWAGQSGRDGRTLPYEPGALPPGTRTGAGRRPPGAGTAGDGRGRWRTLANVGPIVGEAMRGNAVLRAFSGYMVFFLAFYLRSANFGVSHNVALGALVAAAAAGGLAAMAIGSLLRARAPAFILFSMLTLAPIVTATCAWFFSLTTVIAVAFTAALAAGLAKLALDSTVQREIGEEIRSSAFAVSETLNQVANVAGSLAGVLVSILDNGEAGLAIAAAFLTLALVTLVARRRRRILGARAESEAAYAARLQPRAAAAPAPQAALKPPSGLDVVGHGAQHGGDPLRLLGVRLLAAAVGRRRVIEQLDQVFDDQDHLVGLLAGLLGGGHGRRRLEEPDLKRLRTATPLGHAELHPLSLPQRRGPGRQRGGVHEHFAAVVTGEKAIPLVGVVPLDLAGRHAQTSRRRELNNQRSGDRQDAMGTSKAIGPGRPIAASLRPAWRSRPAPGRVRPAGVRGGRAGRPAGPRFWPGRSGPASHVRMVLGRDRVRGRSPKAISPMFQDRIGAIPSAYIQKHTPLPLPATQQARPPRPEEDERPGEDPGPFG